MAYVDTCMMKLDKANIFLWPLLFYNIFKCGFRGFAADWDTTFQKINRNNILYILKHLCYNLLCRFGRLGYLGRENPYGPIPWIAL